MNPNNILLSLPNRSFDNIHVSVFTENFVRGLESDEVEFLDYVSPTRSFFFRLNDVETGKSILSL